MRKKFLPLLLYLFIVTPCAPSVADDNAAITMSGPTLDGKFFDLKSMQGKVVIVHFWATWCATCRQEMPVLDAFSAHHRNDVQMIGISLDRAHDRDKAASYMQGFHFPSLLISEVQKNSLGTPGELPVTYIIDAQGIVRQSLTPEQGSLSEKDLEHAVAPLLK